MHEMRNHTSMAAIAAAGALALASAMGIGRFSLTPILPLMQQDQGLTLSAGSWLAAANYIGYLLGAILCMGFVPQPTRAIRYGLAAIALLTLAMAPTGSMLLWLASRVLAGFASAFVLVGVSAWALPMLARGGKEPWTGGVFAGVGIGIAVAGLLGLGAGVFGWGSQAAWIASAAPAVVLALLLWRPLARADATIPAPVRTSAQCTALPRRAVIAAICYGAFGYGYIIPATFLPALARGFVDDPAVFGAVWPLFGLAAALSTLVAAWIGRQFPPGRVWLFGQWLLTAGVIAPVLALNMATLIIAAVCVGGSFVVITMAGLKEILRIGGAEPSRLIGMMTMAFALGQIAGPLTVALFAATGHSFAWPSLIATAALVISSIVIQGTTRD
jgi:MFS family permease